MPDGPPPRLFSPTEATAILTRAVERQAASTTGLTRAELVDVGRQAGIDEGAIDAAIREVATATAHAPTPVRAARASTDATVRTWKARRAFAIHFSVFVMVNVLLAFLNWISWQDGDEVPWCLIPLLTWGIGLATHFTILVYGHVFPDPRRRAEAGVGARVAALASPQVRVAPAAQGDALAVEDEDEGGTDQPAAKARRA
jgi:2TM domain